MKHQVYFIIVWFVFSMGFVVVGCGTNTNRSGSPYAADTNQIDSNGFGGGTPTFPDAVDADKDNNSSDLDSVSPSSDGVESIDVITSQPDTLPGEPDTSTACGPIGGACNDNNACTINDSCRSDGTCVGIQIGCDDSAPCTVDTCEAGKCVNTPESGFCIIGGTCFNDGQPNPKVGCQVCNANALSTAWSPDDGTPCDDQDPCTESDRCVEGTCDGTPKACDDNNPCTVTGCNQGQCVSVAAAGPCDDADGNPCTEGSCISGLCAPQALSGPCDDNNPCTVGDTCSLGVCKPGVLVDSDNDGYAPVECAGADCNDANNLIHPEANEVCTDNIDNDCDNLIDKADLDCLPTACTYHTDCYPEKVCGYWPTLGNNRCSKPCAGTNDCGPGEVCDHMAGSAQVHFCRDSLSPSGKPDTALCSQNTECGSEKCDTGNCLAFCSDESGCAAPGYTCFPTGNIASAITGICGPDSGFVGGKALGAPCNGDSSLCFSGHCDLTSSSSKLCSPLCSTDTDCALYQECNLVLYTNGPNPQTIPFDPKFVTKTHDTVLACYTRQYPNGSLPVGSVCTHPSQCRTNKCFALVPGQSTQYCTTFCTNDLDCPGTMQCKQDAVSLVSYFLSSFNISNPNAYSFVRLCKIK
ncbi:MAG: putative metal-binding motif-containing protein [Myxococcales bacterium]|nr:putative metal-binding motif-containing protein [Myxococcales bacterium]